MSFELLSEPIRKYIRDKRWESLRPIQAAAISRILTTDANYILASKTASGKTEAAFLPVLSKIDRKSKGVKVLYISPLIALINDQFLRIEQLCACLDLPVTKWHGEASKGGKNRLLKNPEGIVLITPESLEAMFVNKPFQVKELFSNTEFVIIDEIHSFIGTDRGVQLKSIISRLGMLHSSQYRVIGLSATIGDYEEAKKFTGKAENTKVLLDKTSKDIEAEFRFFSSDTEELPLSLLKSLYLETKDNKVLLFPNSRGRAEEVAVKLRKISEKVGGHKNYFSHHSSVDKELREYAEDFAKHNERHPFLISCTSTLELGIDIGSVDEVVQIDATHSIASLVQRVGRSGRREGEQSYLYLYATNIWSLLQSLACWTLYKEGFIEPPLINDKPYDILLHQILSVVKGSSGIQVQSLVKQMKLNFAFHSIDEKAIIDIIDDLINKDLLEKLRQEVIIGLEGEKVVNQRDFYTVFKTEENFKVVHHGNTIGEVPFSLQIKEDENILLAARVWKIKYVDEKAKKIEVVKAPDGKKPLFFGSGVVTDKAIRQRMLDILYAKDQYDFLNDEAASAISEMRNQFSNFPLLDTNDSRPLWVKEKELVLFTFTGTRINRTIGLLFNLAGIKHVHDDRSSSFEIDMDQASFLAAWDKLGDHLNDIDFHIENLVIKNPAILDFSKWGSFLPLQYKSALLREKYLDIEGIKELLGNKLVAN